MAGHPPLAPRCHKGGLSALVWPGESSVMVPPGDLQHQPGCPLASPMSPNGWSTGCGGGEGGWGGSDSFSGGLGDEQMP